MPGGGRVQDNGIHLLPRQQPVDLQNGHQLIHPRPRQIPDRQQILSAKPTAPLGNELQGRPIGLPKRLQQNLRLQSPHL
jgi:hypothetical protein